jgi:hypothetical protein
MPRVVSSNLMVLHVWLGNALFSLLARASLSADDAFGYFIMIAIHPPPPPHTHTHTLVLTRTKHCIMRTEYIRVKVTHISSVIFCRVAWNLWDS